MLMSYAYLPLYWASVDKSHLIREAATCLSPNTLQVHTHTQPTANDRRASLDDHSRCGVVCGVVYAYTISPFTLTVSLHLAKGRIYPTRSQD